VAKLLHQLRQRIPTAAECSACQNQERPTPNVRRPRLRHARPPITGPLSSRNRAAAGLEALRRLCEIA